MFVFFNWRIVGGEDGEIGNGKGREREREKLTVQ